MDAKHPILFFPRGVSRPRSRSDGCIQRNRPAKCTFLFSLHLVESNNEVFLLVQWQSWAIGPTDLPASSSLPPQPCTPFRSHVREGPALLEPLLHWPSGPPLVHTDSGEGGGMGPLTCPHVAVLQSSRCLCVLWTALWGLWTGDRGSELPLSVTVTDPTQPRGHWAASSHPSSTLCWLGDTPHVSPQSWIPEAPCLLRADVPTCRTSRRSAEQTPAASCDHRLCRTHSQDGAGSTRNLPGVTRDGTAWEPAGVVKAAPK